MGGEFGIGYGKLAESFALRMIREAVGELEDGILDRAAEAVADAFAGRQAVLMVVLQQRFGRLTGRLGKARDVEQPLEDGEVCEQVFAKHAVEIKLDVGQADEARGVAQQAQQPAIRDDGEDVLGEVEVFLDVGVRTDTRT